MSVQITSEQVNTPCGVFTLYTLMNSRGAYVKLSPVGAGIVSVVVPDNKGKLADVVLGYEHIEDYFHDGPCAGKVPGRYANRIARGDLVIEGKQYQLAVNNGPNALHGGPEGFQNKVWNSRIDDNAVEFTLVSPDGDEHYPGTLTVTARYTWTDDCRLTLCIKAQSDATTAINLTNHTYWNLGGHDSGTALNHTLQLNASRYLPTDDTLIPTGEQAPVAGTPMDFTSPKRLGQDINADFDALRFGKGYDNCWVVDGDGGCVWHAHLVDPDSGRRLTVCSDQPGVQVYTGNWLNGSPEGKGGCVYHDYDAVAIECQGFPDAPHHPSFPRQIFNAGEEYCRTIVFDFDTV